MYPLKFHPIFKSMIWGGDKLCQYKTIDTDQKNIGESWELSGVPENESVVSNGEFAGKTVIELINEYGPDLLGNIFAYIGVLSMLACPISSLSA